MALCGAFDLGVGCSAGVLTGESGSGANPSHLDANTESVLFLTNESPQPARVGLSITAENVHYYLTSLQLAPFETRAIDIRQLRDAQIADFKGNRIPLTATDGSVNWVRMDDVPMTGRAGYSPACGNEWVRGICEKHKCPDCPHQRLFSPTDDVARCHPSGRTTRVAVSSWVSIRRSSVAPALLLAGFYDGQATLRWHVVVNVRVGGVNGCGTMQGYRSHGYPRIARDNRNPRSWCQPGRIVQASRGGPWADDAIAFGHGLLRLAATA
ncbi:MAG: hypothetical protein M1423_03305 [Acidobacteria bacterium]|nr:hypothetical protein [Acidobacteriota bacterium]